MIKIVPSSIGDLTSKLYTNFIGLRLSQQAVRTAISVDGVRLSPHKTNYFKPEALLEEYKSLRWLVANGDIVASKGDSFTEVNLYEYGVKYTGAISDANNTFVSALNLTKSITWQTLEDVPRSVLHSLIQLQNKGVIELYLRESPMWFEQSNVFLQLRIPIESPLTPTEPPELQYYDTIIGVGDSITDGEFRLSKMFFNNGQPYPFRGVTFDTGAVPGTTLSYMVDNISNFTSKANGRTLFIVRAGINDCNTYLSANGVGDGAAGEVTSWNDLTTSQKDTTIALYRTLVSQLKQYGDVALASITYCDAKGKLLPLPDKGRQLHSGSWNDNCVVPLCQELTPEFFNVETNRPVFDYYTLVYNKPECLDDDNLHFYNDFDYKSVDVGYPNGGGSYTLKNYLVEQLENIKAIPSYLPEGNIDQVLINLCSPLALTNRPFTNRKGNNVVVSGLTGSAPLTSLKGNVTGSIEWLSSHTPSLRNNLSTTNFPPSEGVFDPNGLSSGAFTQTGRTLSFSLLLPNAAGRSATLKLAGLFWTDRENTGWVTRVRIGHGNPKVTTEVTFENVVNNTAGATPVEGVHSGIVPIQFHEDPSVPITLEIQIAGTQINAGISTIEVLF